MGEEAVRKNYQRIRASKRRDTKVEEKAGPQMSVEESHNAIMKDFDMWFMPTMPLNSPNWRPVEQDPVDLNKYQWDNEY